MSAKKSSLLKANSLPFGLKVFLEKFFLGGLVLEKISSPLNGEISVREDLFGKRELMIGGVAQSGAPEKKLWSQLFRGPSSFKVQNCLILGLGGGTAAKLLSAKFPQAKITGIEIDPKVIELGKKYFGLGEIPNLKIMVGDAINLIQSTEHRVQSFDLVIVDLYIGQDFPPGAQNEAFLGKVASLVNKGGRVIFNCLYYNRHHQKLADQLVGKLTPIFPRLETKKLLTNLLISASF